MAQLIGENELYKFKLRIKSKNTVPTASGLASSASGIAALSHALIHLYNLPPHYTPSQLSCIARLGSGSACRSLFGGLVHWKGEGVGEVGWWEGLNGIVMVLCGERKNIASSAGMEQTVKTSSLFQHRINSVVPERIKCILAAINESNFEAFAKIAIKDSNSFHACCLDTYPPISYLTPESMQIITAVHEYNEKMGKILVGYTFDAGPNAVLFGLGKEPANFVEQFRIDFKVVLIPWKLGHGPEIINDHL